MTEVEYNIMTSKGCMMLFMMILQIEMKLTDYIGASGRTLRDT
jgi:hypothetical protein